MGSWQPGDKKKKSCNLLRNLQGAWGPPQQEGYKEDFDAFDRTQRLTPALVGMTARKSAAVICFEKNGSSAAKGGDMTGN